MCEVSAEVSAGVALLCERGCESACESACAALDDEDACGASLEAALTLFTSFKHTLFTLFTNPLFMNGGVVGEGAVNWECEMG
jgi:hypothetical protein